MILYITYVIKEKYVIQDKFWNKKTKWNLKIDIRRSIKNIKLRCYIISFESERRS